MNTKLLTFSATAISISLMFFLRLHASDPCAPPDCCPPKKAHLGQYKGEYTKIHKIIYELKYCEFGDSAGAQVVIGASPGIAIGGESSATACWMPTKEDIFELGEDKAPENPPKGRWVSQLHTETKKEHDYNPPNCYQVGCKYTKIEKTYTKRTRLYEYCQ